MKFARFMASPVGRGIRVFAGLVLILWGLSAGAVPGVAAVVFGLVALAAGAFNWCLLAPLIGAPFRGRDALKTPD
jgi:DUF2892 family protein